MQKANKKEIKVCVQACKTHEGVKVVYSNGVFLYYGYGYIWRNDKGVYCEYYDMRQMIWVGAAQISVKVMTQSGK